MTRPVYTLDADVLVIGGGSAGAMAAIRAKEVQPDQTVVVFEKGDLKYSGCIARGMDALNIVALPGISSPELYVESNSLACEGIMDEPPSYAMAERSYEVLKRLESWDVCFPVDEAGDYEVLQVHPKGKFCVTMKEPELKAILAERVEALDCKVVNRVMTLELLVDAGRAAGAIGMNVRTGELVVCRAKATILSAGGTARFGLPNNGYLYGTYDFPGNTGDGYCMAFRAGAALTGFEYTLHYCIIKDINAPLLYITLTRGAKLFDAFQQEFQQGHVSIRNMLEAHHSGRGPLRIQMSHLDEDKIRSIEELLFTTERPVQERFFAGRGINFRSGDIELWPTETYLCGGHGLTGVRVNERAETTVPGLYAAGDTSCVARGHLSGAFCFGEIAAESATRFAREAELPHLNGQVEALAAAQADRECRGRQKLSIEEFEYKVRRMINDYIVPPKNEWKLNEALLWMDRFRGELRDLVSVNSIHDLFKVYEVENILQSAVLAATASKERRESRWGIWHWRSDYPEKNDEEWLKHIVLTRGDDPDEVCVSHRDVQTMTDEQMKR